MDHVPSVSTNHTNSPPALKKHGDALTALFFFRRSRHADSTVQLWLQRLKDSPSPKRLNLIYLANGEFYLSQRPSPVPREHGGCHGTYIQSAQL